MPNVNRTFTNTEVVEAEVSELEKLEHPFLHRYTSVKDVQRTLRKREKTLPLRVADRLACYVEAAAGFPVLKNPPDWSKAGCLSSDKQNELGFYVARARH